MKPFCKLHNPATYQACDWDLSLDQAGRDYWIPFFKKHLRTILALGPNESGRFDECCAEFDRRFDAFAASPQEFGRVTMFTIDSWRDQILRQFGFVDCFAQMKQRENEKMLPLLPQVCRELDQHRGDQFRAVIDGVFAGNIFDMGATATAQRLIAGDLDFFATRESLPKRPWRIDDFDAFAAKMTSQVHRKAIYFIDNAGSDFLLGAIPFIRWMAMRETHVVIAANERPSLNDMTVHDVRTFWPRILQVERSLESLSIDIVSTGTGEPLIDLSAVSDELNAASKDADLVILEGMGRGVESNLDAVFNCDAVNLAMVKDEVIARRIGGLLYDVVCRFRRAGE